MNKEKKYRMIKILDDTYMISLNNLPVMILNDRELYYFIEMHGENWNIDDIVFGCDFISDQMDNGFIVKKPFKISNSYEIPEALSNNGYSIFNDNLIKRSEKRK